MIIPLLVKNHLESRRRENGFEIRSSIITSGCWNQVKTSSSWDILSSFGVNIFYIFWILDFETEALSSHRNVGIQLNPTSNGLPLETILSKKCF